MKKRLILFLIVCLSFLFRTPIVNAQRVIDYNNIEYKDTAMYVKGEDKPFTGVAISYYGNGKVDAAYLVENGIQNGITKLYYETGELESEFPYVDGNRHGIVKYYNKKGKIESQEFYVDGFSTSESDYKKFLNNEITKEEILKQSYQDYKEEKFSFNFYSLFGILVSIILTSSPILIVWAFIQNKKTLPNLKTLDEYKKKLLLKKLLKYNNDNSTYLHSTYRLNGCGTGFYKIGSFRLEDEAEEINIFAKSQSVFYMPLPFILGYIVCRGKKNIISTITKEDFKFLKKEIEEEIM